MKFTHSLSLVAVLSVTSAHSIFCQLESGGITNPITYGIRDPTYDGPIFDVTTNDIVCNGGLNPTTPSSAIINVQAGSTVQATWRHTLTSTAANDQVYVIDPSHHGPVMAYLKKVGDATTDTGIGGGWFKIQQTGYNPATNVWGVDTLIANAGVQSITIPSCIANGQYLLRVELIALHAAGSPLGAQFYMECAQINITGGTGASSPPTVSFPGAYGQSDPGILINIYQTLTTYVIPGPTPFACGAGGATTAASSKASTTLATTTKASTTSTKAPTTSTTSTTVKISSTTSSPKTTTTTSSGTGSPLYGQCGGIGFTGPTTCASGTCTSSSPYYSQCLP